MTRVREFAKQDPQPIICKLNQSPWDVITFPPSKISRVDSDFNPSSNGISTNPTGVEKRAATSAANIKGKKGTRDAVISRKRKAKVNRANRVEPELQVFQNDVISTSTEVAKSSGAAPINATRKGKRRSGAAEIGNGRGKGKEKMNEVELCDVVDKKGWQCGKEVRRGFTMCEIHQESIFELTGRKRKPSSAMNAAAACLDPNPAPFFYYAGFRPTKSRGSAMDRASNS